MAQSRPTRVGEVVGQEVETFISLPSQLIVPYGQNQLNGALTAGVTASLTMDDVSTFEDAGYVQIESEIIGYTAKSGSTLTTLTRGMFGTGDATHADNTAVYQAQPNRVKITIHDEGVPKAPAATPTIEAVNMKGTTKITSGNMTQEGSEVGIYYHDFIIRSDETPNQIWDFRITVQAISGKTNKYRRIALVLDEPASEEDVWAISAGAGLRVCTQDGYYDSTGTFVAWTDAYVGYFEDDNGNRVQDGLVTWYNKVSGEIEYQSHPPGQCETDVLGNWVCMMEAGTYDVHFYKSGIKDVHIERTVA